MKKTNRFILTVLLMASSIAFAKTGTEGGGGGQGAMDVNGNFHYIDILSKEEIGKKTFLPSNEIDLISKIKCTNVLYKEIKDSQFALEFIEAQRLLEAAGETLIPKNVRYVKDGGSYLEEKPLAIGQNFKVTAFPLPQIADATQVDPGFQVQIGLFRHGFVYLQEQALLELKEKSTGVFIKEALRMINYKNDFQLSNHDLEEATYLIFHGHLEQFKKSKFAQVYTAKDPLDLRTWKTKDYVSMKYGTWDYQNLTTLPETFDFIEKDGLDWYSYRFNPSSPQGSLWSTKTGKLLGEKECFNN